MTAVIVNVRVVDMPSSIRCDPLIRGFTFLRYVNPEVGARELF